MCSKRLGPQGEVGDTFVFEQLFVSPTPSGGWDKVGTNGRLGQGAMKRGRAWATGVAHVIFGEMRGDALLPVLMILAA